MKGKKTGGRVAGVPNRRTQLEDVLTKIDPTDGEVYWTQLHAIAALPHDDAHARLKALSLVFAYKYGKPIERQEHSGPGGGPIPYTWEK